MGGCKVHEYHGTYRPGPLFKGESGNPAEIRDSPVQGSQSRIRSKRRSKAPIRCEAAVSCGHAATRASPNRPQRNGASAFGESD